MFGERRTFCSGEWALWATCNAKTSLKLSIVGAASQYRTVIVVVMLRIPSLKKLKTVGVFFFILVEGPHLTLVRPVCEEPLVLSRCTLMKCAWYTGVSCQFLSCQGNKVKVMKWPEAPDASNVPCHDSVLKPLSITCLYTLALWCCFPCYFYEIPVIQETRRWNTDHMRWRVRSRRGRCVVLRSLWHP